MRYDWQYFKENVSVAQVAESLGYVHNKSKGNGDKVEFTHPTEENVIISRKGNVELYFTRFDDSDKGTVIDFVKNRLDKFNVSYETEAEGINKVLSHFANIPYDYGKGTFQPSKKKEKEAFNKENYIIRDAKLNDLAYLMQGRKISEQTLRVFLPYIKAIKHADPAKSSYTNIGFPYTEPLSDELKGMEVVNYGWKRHAKGSDKTNACWIADLSNGGVVTDVFFGESCIDLMSFYELKKHRVNQESSVFVSTGGGLSSNQISNVLAAYPHAKIHTAFDNDLAGNIYDIKVAAIRRKKPLSIRKEDGRVFFELPNKQFSLSLESVSLTNFRRYSGMRPGISVHKAKVEDFNQTLQESKKTNLRTSR